MWFANVASERYAWHHMGCIRTCVKRGYECPSQTSIRQYSSRCVSIDFLYWILECR